MEIFVVIVFLLLSIVPITIIFSYIFGGFILRQFGYEKKSVMSAVISFIIGLSLFVIMILILEQCDKIGN